MYLKTSLVIVVIVLVLTFVSAYTIGQIVNQNQLNNFDLEGFDFNATLTTRGKNFGVTESQDYAFVNVERTTLEKNDDGTYTIVIKETGYKFWLERFYKCTDTNTVSNCLLQAKAQVVKLIKRDTEEERAKLLRWQTKDLYDSFIIDLNNDEIR